MQAGQPWQVFFINMVGPLTPTPRGNTIKQVQSIWRNTLPIPNATDDTKAKLLGKRVFCYLAVPELIHIDQGPQIEAIQVAELYPLWSGQKSHTPTYHSDINEMVKRVNRHLGIMLQSMMLK